MPSTALYTEQEEQMATGRSIRKPQPFALVLYGVSGDLARRMLLPAFYDLMLNGLLPENFCLIGNSRSIKSPEAFREETREAVKERSRNKFKEDAWNQLARRLDHVTGDPTEVETQQQIGEKLKEVDKKFHTEGNHIFHIATPPKTFLFILQALQQSGRIYKAETYDHAPWPRVLVEKPFGMDLESARQINDFLATAVNENQIYRVDHYLGKETVQNIFVFRFANVLFEPIWNRQYIDYVEINAPETLDVKNRGGFYDQVGVIRDVVQNHLFQMLALTAMEPPTAYDGDSVSFEKNKIFQAVRPVSQGETEETTVLGQYRGYKDVSKVAPESRTPTFAAMKLMIDNWRWQGVPFYLRAGKSLASGVTEIAVHFRSIPFCLFGRRNVCEAIENNVITIRIKPDEGISLKFAAKEPGEAMAVGSANMNFNYADTFRKPHPAAYEHIFLGCLHGDRTHFARRETVEQEWRIVEPILKWEETPSAPLYEYEPGSQGPDEANALMTRDGRNWREI